MNWLEEWRREMQPILAAIMADHPGVYSWRDEQSPVVHVDAKTGETKPIDRNMLFPSRPDVVVDRPLHGYAVTNEEQPVDETKRVTWTQADLDDELEQATHKTRQNEPTEECKPTVKTWPESLKRQLCAQVSLTLDRQRLRRTEGQPAKAPKIKQWRTKRPPPEVEHRWRHLAQNSQEWYDIRVGSSGASSLYLLLGWSEMKTSTCAWLEDTGQAGEPERTAEECFPLDEGHYREDEARRISELLLGCVIRPTGLWLHPDFPDCHVSPDGIIEYPDTVKGLIHLLLLNDSLRGLWECKCTMFRALFNRGGAGIHGFPHSMRASHAIQIQAQMSALKADWCEISNMWHFSEQSGIKPMFQGPFEYSSTDGGETFENHERITDMDTKDEGQESKTPGCWKVAEILISRVYASEQFQQQIYETLHKHQQGTRCAKRGDHLCALRQDVRQAVASDAPIGPQDAFPWMEKVKGIPPEREDKTESPYFSWLPLVHACFYLTGSPSHLQNVAEIFESDLLTSYMGSTATRPLNWVGEWPPRLDVAIQTFEKQQPVVVTLHSLSNM